MNRADQSRTRIAALQSLLKEKDLTGFFVPRTDFWQGEEVMACDERLRWLTGFTGSTGMALVLQDRAALFVDGRYTLQAAQELHGTGIEICHLTEQPWQEWMGDAKGAQIAIDPMLLTRSWSDKAKAELARKGAMLIKLESNLVDLIWTDRPAPQFTPAEVFPLELAGETSLAKRLKLGKELQQRGFAGAFITDPMGIAWLLNIRARDYAHTPVALSVFFLKHDGTGIWMTDPSRGTAEIMAHVGAGVSVQPPSYFVAQTADWAGQTLLLDEATAADWLYEKLAAAGASLKLDRCITAMPKASKNSTEIEGMRAAHRRDGAALAQFLQWFDEVVAPGQSSERESDIISQLEASRARTNEYRGASFETICGFAASGAVVHYHTTPESDKAVAGNSLLLLDSGAQYVDGTTDLTRTLAVGQPTEDQRLHYTLVLQGHIALATAKFPVGTTGHQLDALARAPLWRTGLSYDHGTGHGVGHYLSVHEGPARISAYHIPVALQPGMVLSNEPGYYKANAYGIRIENLITVRDSAVGADGRKFLEFETLTLAPYDRRLIVTDMLTAAEKDWINAYHARVLAEIGPSLAEPQRHWLQQACAPLS